MTNQTKNFRAMTAQAERLSLPRSFQADLTEHDAKAVTDEHEYLWVLYAGGTHLVKLEQVSLLDFRKGQKFLSYVDSVTDPGYCVGGDIHIFHVSNGVAAEITRFRALELAEDLAGASAA